MHTQIVKVKCFVVYLQHIFVLIKVKIDILGSNFIFSVHRNENIQE